MRLLPDIRFGTERYPEKVARRLRAVNITAWSAAAVLAWFALLRLLDPEPLLRARGFVNVAFAISLALLPLLHRFNSLAAPLALIALVYAYLFRTIYQHGMAPGSYLFYFTATAFGILLIGTERVLIALTLGAAATALIIVLHLIVPYSTGLQPPPGAFIGNVIANSAILFGVVFYAIRQVTRSEAMAERELQRSESLLLEVQDRTRQLDAANKYKSHFLASASHDLRQPLHALNLFVAQLRTETNPAERDRLTGRIDAAVGSMSELFEALLDMTKLEAGILQPSVTEFPVSRLLERIETTFAEAARKKGLNLSVVRSDARVASDPILLERILLNLVSNAVRYTEHGGVLVGCRRRGDRLRVDVYDTGPGIPEDQQSRVFGEYYQLGAAEMDRHSTTGLGLGLAIVDRLGRLLGHPVELRSRPGRGSRFSIFVPYLAEKRDAADAIVWPIAADPARGKLVVMIDDDPLVLEGMSGLLRSWGCTVAGGDNATSALSRIEAARQQPDLIISDYRLANGENGIETIKQLRERFGRNIPALLISGDTAPDRLREADQAGFPLLHKPVAPMRLRALLNQLLTAQTGAPAPPRSESAGARA